MRLSLWSAFGNRRHQSEEAAETMHPTIPYGCGRRLPRCPTTAQKAVCQFTTAPHQHSTAHTIAQHRITRHDSRLFSAGYCCVDGTRYTDKPPTLNARNTDQRPDSVRVQADQVSKQRQCRLLELWRLARGQEGSAAISDFDDLREW